MELKSTGLEKHMKGDCQQPKLNLSSGYALLDYKNEDISEKLKILPIVRRMQNCRISREHVRRMENNRKPKQIIAHKPRRRESGKTWHETTTGHMVYYLTVIVTYY
jgi:hypothetical protein